MYIPNFNLLAEFGEELCKEQTQTVRKKGKKLRNVVEKSKLPKGISKAPTKYTYLISSSWLNLEGVMRGTNYKKFEKKNT